MTGVLFLPLTFAVLMIGEADPEARVAIELPRGAAATLHTWGAPLPGSLPGHAAGALPPESGPAAVPPSRALSTLPFISSHFGRRSDPIHGARRMHFGIDIPGRRGTPVLASETGRIRFAGTAGGYGRMVEIVHERGFVTRYGHLDRIFVKKGTSVQRGQPIGAMGASGRATGSHVHFELRVDGRAVDPITHLGRRAQSRPLAAAGPSPITSDPPHRSGFARARALARTALDFRS